MRSVHAFMSFLAHPQLELGKQVTFSNDKLVAKAHLNANLAMIVIFPRDVGTNKADCYREKPQQDTFSFFFHGAKIHFLVP